MIRYALKCAFDHEFDGWFASSDGYEDQKARGLIACPECGVSQVDKAIMAPSVITSERKAARSPSPMEQAAEALSQYVAAHFDYVGKEFADEARDIHAGLAPQRPIYGEAQPDEVRALLDDGIAVSPLPVRVTPKGRRAEAAPAVKARSRQRLN